MYDCKSITECALKNAKYNPSLAGLLFMVLGVENDFVKSCHLRSQIIFLIHKMDTIEEILSDKSKFPYSLRYKRRKLYQNVIKFRKTLQDLEMTLYKKYYNIGNISEIEYTFYSNFLENLNKNYNIDIPYVLEKEDYIIALYKTKLFFNKTGIEETIRYLKKFNDKIK